MRAPHPDPATGGPREPLMRFYAHWCTDKTVVTTDENGNVVLTKMEGTPRPNSGTAKPRLPS